MANSVDPDQTAPSGAVWSGSTLFVYVILSDALVFEFLGHLPYLQSSGCKNNFSMADIERMLQSLVGNIMVCQCLMDRYFNKS